MIMIGHNYDYTALFWVMTFLQHPAEICFSMAERWTQQANRVSRPIRLILIRHKCRYNSSVCPAGQINAEKLLASRQHWFFLHMTANSLRSINMRDTLQRPAKTRPEESRDESRLSKNTAFSGTSNYKEWSHRAMRLRINDYWNWTTMQLINNWINYILHWR